SRHVSPVGVETLLIVVELSPAEAELVDERRAESPYIREHGLPGLGKNVRLLILKIGDLLRIVVAPTEAAEPGGFGVLGIIDALIELLPGDRTRTLAGEIAENVIARSDGLRIKFEQLEGNRIEAARGNDIVRKLSGRDCLDVAQ